MKAKVYISRDNTNLKDEILKSFHWVGVLDRLSRDDRVFIKPNLTFTIPKPGVTVTLKFLRTVIEILMIKTKNIFVVESPGGYGAFKTEEAFIGHGLDIMARKMGFKLLNLEKCESEFIVVKGTLVPLPKCLLTQDARFVTIAVPKVHSMTGISLCLKNQWGCIPDPMRIIYHHIFNEAIVKINKTLNPLISIIDGTFGLTNNGPIDGVSFPFNTFLVSSNIFAIDKVMRHIMGWTHKKVAYLDYIEECGLFPENIATNIDPNNLVSKEFVLRRNIWNYAGLLAFNSLFFTKLFYKSPISNLLHDIMYSFRKKLDFPRFTK